jgi:hypothetical protein
VSPGTYGPARAASASNHARRHATAKTAVESNLAAGAKPAAALKAPAPKPADPALTQVTTDTTQLPSVATAGNEPDAVTTTPVTVPTPPAAVPTPPAAVPTAPAGETTPTPPPVPSQQPETQTPAAPSPIVESAAGGASAQTTAGGTAQQSASSSEAPASPSGG